MHILKRFGLKTWLFGQLNRNLVPDTLTTLSTETTFLINPLQSLSGES